MDSYHQNLLKKHKLSLTSVRLAVLDALQAQPHSDAAAIFGFVKSKITTTSMQAIYNNLNTLVEHGIVREIKPRGRPSLYEARVGDNHHHLVCRQCQGIVDTDCFDTAPCLVPSENHGFIVDEAEVIFWGLCPSCQTSIKEGGVNK